MRRTQSAVVEFDRPAPPTDTRRLLDTLTGARVAVVKAWALPELEPSQLPPCPVCGEDLAQRWPPADPAYYPGSAAPSPVRNRYGRGYARAGFILGCRCGRCPKTERTQQVLAALRACRIAYAEALVTGKADDWGTVPGTPLPPRHIDAQTLSDLWRKEAA